VVLNNTRKYVTRKISAFTSKNATNLLRNRKFTRLCTYYDSTETEKQSHIPVIQLAVYCEVKMNFFTIVFGKGTAAPNFYPLPHNRVNTEHTHRSHCSQVLLRHVPHFESSYFQHLRTAPTIVLPKFTSNRRSSPTSSPNNVLLFPCDFRFSMSCLLVGLLVTFKPPFLQRPSAVLIHSAGFFVTTCTDLLVSSNVDNLLQFTKTIMSR